MLQVPSVNHHGIQEDEKQEWETIYLNSKNNDDNDFNDSEIVLRSPPPPPPPPDPPKYFTLHNPIGFEAQAQRQRRRERAEAIKKVTWTTYLRYFKGSRESLIQTSLVSAIAPLLMTMGLIYVCWGIEEMLDDFSSSNDDVLQISVFLTAGSFISTFFLLLLGIHFHQRFILIACVVALVITFIIEIFTIVWILIRSSRKHLEDFLQNLLSSYNLSKNDQLINKIQKEFSCCGISKHQDWFNISLPQKFNETNLPRSCCYFHVPEREKFRSSCYVTNNDSDSTSWALSRKGCLNPLKKFLSVDDPKKWLYIGAGMVTLVLTGVLTIIHISRTFKGISVHLRPEIRVLIKKLVDDCTDQLFAQSDHVVSVHLREYVKDRVQQSKNLGEVTSLLLTLTDTLYYMTYSRPADLAHFILQGKPGLISQFENDLRMIQEKESTKKKKPIQKNEGEIKDSTTTLILEETQVPHNSVQDLSPLLPLHLTSSVSIGSSNIPIIQGDPSSIVVPYELKRRMKNVELFLMGLKEYEKRLLTQRHQSQLIKERHGRKRTLEPELGQKSLTRFREMEDAAGQNDDHHEKSLHLAISLAAYRQQYFGGSVIFRPLKIFHHTAPLTAETELMTERDKFIHTATHSVTNDRRQRRQLRSNHNVS